MRKPFIPDYNILPSHVDVTATVLDEYDEPVYANVWVKDTPTFGTQTDFDTGQFTLSQVPFHGTLVFSYQDVTTEVPVHDITDTVIINTLSSLDGVDLGTISTNKNKKMNWLPWIIGTIALGGIIYIAHKNKPVKVSL